jgi:hypothetical protein
MVIVEVYRNQRCNGTQYNESTVFSNTNSIIRMSSYTLFYDTSGYYVYIDINGPLCELQIKYNP